MRVAAYCRVSTDKDDQVNSLESQKRYFTRYIASNPLWMLWEIYVDEGISGTSTKKRAAFQRMIADANARRFDLILTKEISRFARNTLDSIFYTRKLKELGIGVIFLNDNINTMDPDAELRLTILSSIAQEESRKTSDRVKWGQKRRMEQGVVFGRDMLGYDVREGKLIVNEAGAEIVRLIFHKFVNEDKGTHTIARELREAGIPTATYMKQWSNTVILRILRNEKYCGDLVQKKTITPNYLTHEKKYNRGEEALVALSDHHQPIIKRALFDAAQQVLRRRTPSAENRAKHSNRYCFSGKLKCALCGSSYVARSKKRADGSIYKAWRCYQSANHGVRKTDQAGNEIGCDNRCVREDDLQTLLRQVVKHLSVDQASILGPLVQTVWSALRLDTCDNRPERLAERLRLVKEKREALVELYLNQDISKADFRRIADKCKGEAEAIRQAQQATGAEKTSPVQPQALLEDIKSTIEKLARGEVWNDAFYRHLLEEITVQPDGTMEVKLCLLPQTFRYLLCDEKTQKKHRACTDSAVQATILEQNSGNDGTSEPISVNSPFSSG